MTTGIGSTDRPVASGAVVVTAVTTLATAVDGTGTRVGRTGRTTVAPVSGCHGPVGERPGGDSAGAFHVPSAT